ncbi:MAG: protein kinase [Deltaproteobacteria bacterium]|nr:protein kinase [Deltaproteobacteria bacterium]
MAEKVKDPRIGSILNERYRVTERLGEGGVGAVYRGEQIQLGKPVAIKFLHDLLLFNTNSRVRFVREAQAMSKLSHPHCVSVIDYGIDDSPYIVMDYVTGKSLDTLIREEQISLVRTIRIVLQILAGLAHAHGQGIIHRDIKPANIIINEATGTGEHARILDFSLAKMADGSGLRVTGASLVMGTPSYMSPEQSFGEEVDARTDLYSVGIVIFELLTGQKPFPGEDVTETLKMQRETIAPALGEVVPDISFSDEIEAVLKKALAKTRDERFPTAFDFMEALAAVPESGDQGEILGGMKSAVRSDDSAETIDMSPAKESAKSEPPDETVSPERPSPKRVIFGVLSLIAAAFVVLSIAMSMSSKKETVAANENPVSHKETVKPPSKPTDRPRKLEEKDIKDAKNLIAAGRTDEAIAILQKLRASFPRATEPPYLLGNIFSEKSWWSAAIERYENAIDLNPEYRKDPVLNQNLIRALGNDKSQKAARKFILEQIGQDAIPHLREAMDGDGTVRLRRRAARVLEKLSEK